MDKWSCLWVIIDFVFDQQQPKLGHVFFLYWRHSMRLNNQYLGACADGVECLLTDVAVFVIISTSFLILASLFLPALADANP